MNFTKATLTLSVFFIFYFGTASLISYPSLISSASAASKLGELVKFKKIVSDTEVLVKKGDLAGAKSRIKDLEISWDEAESALKPRSAGDWHKVDKAIDNALSALREKTPSKDACTKALAELLIVFEQIEKI
ncbi:MAG: hypothetical protein WA160_01800 [Pseudobdellovibrio sp.]|jgi:hypothetical protein